VKISIDGRKSTIATSGGTRASTHPGCGPSTCLAMTPRLKDGQVQYRQVERPQGN
jgi:hypothetical protein